ncbi:MAG TPA: uroporphyrinogen-III C-methyltransferase [Gallionella sp.]|nr:uroporphyrinogen-III C-methyltransferase [Gallionella sp.]
MSEQTPQSENTGPEDRPESSALPDHTRPKHRTTVADVFSRISITQLTLAVLVMIFLWQWLDGYRAISDMQEQLAKKLSEMDGSNKANQVLLAQDQDRVRELSAKVATLESRYEESQNQRDALESLYNRLSANSDEAVLAEVEQMLLTAAQQLQLTANVRAALIAMQGADSRLQSLNRPAFGELRQAISRDMDKLRALHDVDITGINIQLNNLIAVVDRMPLAYQQRSENTLVEPAAPPQEETSWQRLLREIWQEARQLVRIENTDKAEIPLLPPNQEFFLRENLKLSLLSARLALLSRDEASFKQGLKTAQLWTARYFDAKSSESIRMSGGLNKLVAADIHIEIPDISASLQAVRKYRLIREHEPKIRFELAPKEPKVGLKGQKAAK